MTSRNSHELSSTGRGSWTPAQLLMMAPHPDGVLYRYRDPDGTDWWSDGTAMFQGEPPAICAAPTAPSACRWTCRASRRCSPWCATRPARRSGPPIAAYEDTSGHGAVPVVVFVDTEHDPDLHVDARYLAYAEARFNAASFWRVRDAVIAVRSARGLQGIVAGRDLPPEHRGRP